jgi:hypothetical protein
MTDEPERIWVDDERPIGGELHVFTDPPVTGVEQLVVGYIRADLAEAIVRAALERAADEVPHWHSCDGGCVRHLASDPAEVAAIIKAAGEDRG